VPDPRNRSRVGPKLTLRAGGKEYTLGVALTGLPTLSHLRTTLAELSGVVLILGQLIHSLPPWQNSAAPATTDNAELDTSPAGANRLSQERGRQQQAPVTKQLQIQQQVQTQRYVERVKLLMDGSYNTDQFAEFAERGHELGVTQADVVRWWYEYRALHDTDFRDDLTDAPYSGLPEPPSSPV
jgi:hypothetical protein